MGADNIPFIQAVAEAIVAESSKLQNLIGRIALRTNLAGQAGWSKVGDNNSQLRYGDWTAWLNGGVQTGSDWAAVHIPVNDLPMQKFLEFAYSYYLSEAQAAGLAICLATYNPDDHSERAEISQTAGVPPSEEGHNFYAIDRDTPSLFWYGNNVDSDLVEGDPYTLADFWGDKAFGKHVIYMIKLEWGYWGAGTAGDCWVTGLKLNGIEIPLGPSLNEQLDMVREGINLLGAISLNVIEHHTSDDTLTKTESGSTHTNLGASAEVTFTLPQDALAGCRFRFVVMADGQELRIDPGAAGAIYINGAKQTDDLYIWADDIAESVELVADGNGDWVAIGAVGTWSVETV